MSAGQFATARRGFDRSDMEFIASKRLAGVPDAALARMIGRSVFDVRSVRPFVQAQSPAAKYRATFSPGMEIIARKVATEHRLTVSDLIGPARIREVAWPRQQAMWECHQTGLWTKQRIGVFFGGRDHSTVAHGLSAHESRQGRVA